MTVDLSACVILLGNVVGTSNVHQLSANERYSFDPSGEHETTATRWRGNTKQIPSPPFFRLCFGEHMFSPGGWILGSSDDTDLCDLQLAPDNRNGVSRRHIKVDISPVSHNPRITNLSENPVRFEDQGEERKRKRTIILRKTQSAEVVAPVAVDLGQVSFQLWRPALSNVEKRTYKINAERSSRDFMEALPRPTGLVKLSSGASTAAVRFGNKKAVYHPEESAGTSSGSFASVMKVRELRSGRFFAAKIPHYKAADNAGEHRRRWESLHHEFEKLMEMRHPHIVETLEIVPGRNMAEPPWLIMEWILCDLGSADLDPCDNDMLLLHLAAGLNFIHSKDFTHRDLKPQNVLLLLTGRRLITAKIADFGTTKYNPIGNMQTYTGSGVYMAPEFWELELNYTKAVDLWALGMIALSRLAQYDPESDRWDSRFPPTKPDHLHWVHNIVETHVPQAPAQYQALLRGLICQDPIERWSAAETEEWLLEFLGNTTREKDLARVTACV